MTARRIGRQVARFRAAIPADVALHYAVKANPYAPLLEAMAGMVDGFDVASAGELGRQVAHLGLPISFAGPGKRDQELETAIRAGVTINLESEGEAERALAICGRARPDGQAGGPGQSAVRRSRAPGRRWAGCRSQFGVDHDRVAGAGPADLIEAGAEWRGLHIFAGSQALHADALIELQRETVALAASIADEAGHAPPQVNLGGGFGIPYFAKDAAARRRSGGSGAGQDVGGTPENPGRHPNSRSSSAAGWSARRGSI